MRLSQPRAAVLFSFAWTWSVTPQPRALPLTATHLVLVRCNADETVPCWAYFGLVGSGQRGRSRNPPSKGFLAASHGRVDFCRTWQSSDLGRSACLGGAYGLFIFLGLAYLAARIVQRSRADRSPWWPSTSNHTMELTTSQRTTLFSVLTSFSPAAPCVPARGSSSCSR